MERVFQRELQQLLLRMTILPCCLATGAVVALLIMQQAKSIDYTMFVFATVFGGVYLFEYVLLFLIYPKRVIIFSSSYAASEWLQRIRLGVQHRLKGKGYSQELRMRGVGQQRYISFRTPRSRVTMHYTLHQRQDLPIRTSGYITGADLKDPQLQALFLALEREGVIRVQKTPLLLRPLLLYYRR